jgi:uncharacterized membrane protein YgdD (TMEM256/DUF423 family)
MTDVSVIALVILAALLRITLAAGVAFVVGSIVFSGRRRQQERNPERG